MAPSSEGDDNEAVGHEICPYNLLMLIKDTYLGKDLLSAVSGTVEHVFGEELADALFEDYEALDDEDAVDDHDETCPDRTSNGIYEFVRDEPCTCGAAFYDEEELLAVFPDDKQAVITALIKYGSDIVDYLPRSGLKSAIDKKWHFLRFAQKLDNVILPVCREAVAKAESDPAARFEVNDLLKVLLDARSALQSRIWPIRASKIVYLYQSIECLVIPGFTDKPNLVYKIIEEGNLPQELADMIHYYITDKEKAFYRFECCYYRTLRDR